MDAFRMRTDSIVLADGRDATAWAYARACSHPRATERLAFLYSLADIPGAATKFRAFACLTHEIVVYHLDADIGIDFDRNLWEQPRVAPLLPARFTYQFMAGSDAQAKMRVQSVVDEAAASKLPSSLSRIWADSFNDGADLSDPLANPCGAMLDAEIDDDPAPASAPLPFALP